jgi:hypothetical protein
VLYVGVEASVGSASLHQRPNRNPAVSPKPKEIQATSIMFMGPPPLDQNDLFGLL